MDIKERRRENGGRNDDDVPFESVVGVDLHGTGVGRPLGPVGHLSQMTRLLPLHKSHPFDHVPEKFPCFDIQLKVFQSFNTTTKVSENAFDLNQYVLQSVKCFPVHCR